VGHAFTEGHSSITSDVMDWQDCQCATIDQDAQAMLEAVYGPQNSGNGGGGGGCGTCQLGPISCSTTVGEVLCGTPSLGPYYWKAWYLSQGAGGLVPADPHTNPVMLITPDQCLTDWYTKQYAAWLSCLAGNPA
jgi:hypothetical protein